MSEIFEKFKALLQPVRASISQAVEAAIQPLQATVSALARRLELLELREQQPVTPKRAGTKRDWHEQSGKWSAWPDHDADPAHGPNIDQDYGKEYIPIELSWAERAARV